MHSRIIQSLVLAMAMVAAAAAQAQLGDYTANPETNSSDWEAKISQLGGTVNKNIDFEGHALGALQGDFYAVTDGVTLTASGDVDQVVNGAGPNDGNIDSPPLSPGEGPHAVSNYLADGGAPSSLTVSFAQSVWGAGLFTVDYFNPFASNILTIEAFDGPDGTGNSLGVVTSATFNFQPNHLYFMGVTSDAKNIRSIVFTDVNSDTGDTIGLDDIWFAAGTVAPVPSTGLIARLALMLGLLLVAAFVLRRRRA